jgi:hypothetical protein
MDQELDVQTRWRLLEEKFRERFGKPLTMESLLFLIGIRELGARPREFSKEEKLDLMHIAICRLLAESGYYRLSHLDQQGWPHWELLKPLPYQDMFSQLHLLKAHALAYVDSEALFD